MDIVTYCLCKKLIKSSATGIKSVSIDEDYNLIFTMGDGSIYKVPLPIKPDCINFEIVSRLPISDISETTVYLVPQKFTENNEAYYQYMFVDGKWQKIGISGMPYADETIAGIVKVDGKSIKATVDGVISVDKDYVVSIVEETMENSIIEDVDIDKLFQLI